MKKPGKSDCDPNSESEQDIVSETGTLSGTQDSDIYKPVPVPYKIRNIPTNYLCVDKEDVPICGQYFIDASIPPIPKTVPYVVARAENIFLHSSVASITANIWVTGNNHSRRVSMNLFAKQGIQAKVHDAFSTSESVCRPSLDVELRTDIGYVYLSLPRCFRGLITIHPSACRENREKITLSPGLEECAALLSDVKGSRVYFVGHRPRAWMSWRNDDVKGEAATAGEGRVPDEPLDTVTVVHWTTAVRIRWDGELEPEFPE